MAKRTYVGNAIISEYNQEAFGKTVDRICKENKQFVPEITFRTHTHTQQPVSICCVHRFLR